MTRAGLDTLDEEECARLLRARSFGRIGVKLGRELLVLPIFYAMAGDDVVFRTGPGTKLDAAVLRTRVVFEIDDPDEGWSVLASGPAQEVRAGPELGEIRALLGDAWPVGERERIVRVRINKVTGRRIRRP
jgi:nitroimidazol reductase NimA-like FMN-containing flavoprotein (pyridoxamine 5'-phosphate oxidase superfamily)